MNWFTQKKFNHASTHVFVKLTLPLKIDITKGTPKQLI